MGMGWKDRGIKGEERDILALIAVDIPPILICKTSQIRRQGSQ